MSLAPPIASQWVYFSLSSQMMKEGLEPVSIHEPWALAFGLSSCLSALSRTGNGNEGKANSDVSSSVVSIARVVCKDSILAIDISTSRAAGSMVPREIQRYRYGTKYPWTSA